MESTPDGVVIGIADVYVEVRKLAASVGTLTDSAKATTDHETRLRALERWRYALPGSLFLAAGALAAQFLKK